jgi:hypothetical protein
MNQTAAEIYLHITQTKNIKYATPYDHLVRLDIVEVVRVA